jgi:TolA-binding protein
MSQREADDELLASAQRAFAAEAPVLAGDEARIERMARLVEKRTRPAADIRRWRYIAQGAVAGIVLAGVAIGAISAWWSPGEPPPATLQQPAARPSPPELATGAPQSGGVGELAAPTPPPAASSAAGNPSQTSSSNATLAPAAPRHSAAAPAVAPLGSAAAASLPPTTASELFAAANRARVNGDVAEAIALSRRLQSEFPRSTEAVSSHLSLGLLYLQQGQAQAALAEFRLYRGSAGGAGQAEALWGEAKALRQLGRSSEERTALEELLARYPRSAFSGAAQKRLADLH